MRCDAIIVGAELDGQIAALRLLEQGYSVRILARGAGSLHYAPGGIHLLGYRPGDAGGPVEAPLEVMSELDVRHPYRIMGRDRVQAALDWFFRIGRELEQDFVLSGANAMTMTPAGLPHPTYAPFRHQACLTAGAVQRLTILAFDGHQDFPASVVMRALERSGISVDLLSVEPPDGRTENAGLARAFDRHPDPHAFFEDIGRRLVPGTELVLFPAVLGLERHAAIMEAAGAMGQPFMEVPTLPVCVPGIRLAQALDKRLIRSGALLHQGVQARGIGNGAQEFLTVQDDGGRTYEASVFILASGGLLMGGLEVGSHGQVGEAVFGLGVSQTAPLAAEGVDLALDALHQTGVETDAALRPRRNGSDAHENLFVTGATLGHWNPTQEASSEGVAIATGWAAAEAARAYLEAR